jgi:hypothetical protein
MLVRSQVFASAVLVASDLWGVEWGRFAVSCIRPSLHSSLTSWLARAILPAMASRLRLQYEGAIYHVINRGDHQELREFRWSSFPEYLRSPASRPGWLRVDRLLGEHGIQNDSPAGRAELL